MNKPSMAVMIAHGGVGDFLFQLDLAKRLELSGIKIVFLIRKNSYFLSDILHSSDVYRAKIISAQSWHYLFAIFRIWIECLFEDVVIVNSFHFTKLRLPTKLLYRLTLLFSGRVLVCQHQVIERLPYEQLTYQDSELIWQRNNRLVAYLTGETFDQTFPIISFKKGSAFIRGEYVHVHPVASVLDKSYPPQKLLSALKAVGNKYKILLTITPHAESWYMTEELKQYVASQDNIAFLNKNFEFAEIAGYIAGASKFITVNTGLLWLALGLRQKVVVCDIDTAYEWNPSAYGALRLSKPSAEELAEAIRL